MIDTSSWERFSLLGDLEFQLAHGQRLKQADRIIGDTPFITAGKENRGVSQSISNSVPTYDNPITVDMFGNCFYQDFTCAGDDNVYFFTHKELSKYAKIFISIVIGKEIKDMYNYGDQFRQKDAESLSVLLPVIDTGEPNYQWIDQYISELITHTNRRLEIFQKIIDM